MFYSNFIHSKICDSNLKKSCLEGKSTTIDIWRLFGIKFLPNF